MTDISGTITAAEPPIWNSRTLAAAIALAALIVIGDVLLWYHSSGVNILVFFTALIFAIVAVHPKKLGESRTVLLLLVALVSTTPFFETESPWALLTAQAGITLLALGISDNLPKFEDWLAAFTRFGILAPVRLLGDGRRVLTEGGQQKIGGRLLRAAMVWLMPLVFAAIFVLLFAAANPVIEFGLRAIQLDRLLELLQPGRVILWGVIAVACWPLLVPRLLPWTPLREIQGPLLPRAEGLLFGRAAILNSLIVFNAVFAVQTVLDLIFLWGGVRLPDGMGHAEYAHRGAYPLIVTALLAAAFVLAAMRRNGPGATSPLIRTLVYLWITQNVWLVISSLLRLKLYVEVYYLSEMRVAAAIWMSLVALGLVLIVVKIALDRSNKWLVMSNLLALMVTLWAVAWLDVRSYIAFYNVRHSYDVTGEGVPLDQYYLYDLGPASIPALDEFISTATHTSPSQLTNFRLMREELADRVLLRDAGTETAQPFGRSWHGWSWRNERLEAYLVQHPFAPSDRGAIE